MKNKIMVLLGIVTLNITTGFSQSPERMQEKKSSNIKEPSEKAVILYNKGHDYFGKKEYASAIHNYEMAIAVDSDYIDAYNNLGLIFYETNVLDSASYYLEKSLQKFPSGTTALQNLSLVEEKKGDLTKSLGYHKQIIVLEPENPEGFYNTGRILTTMGKLDEALIQTQQAEKLYTKSKSPYTSDCHYLLLVIYFNMNNKPLAKKYLTLCKKENVQISSEIENGLK
jgi:tetratricopeptide (TPR) repeat protein